MTLAATWLLLEKALNNNFMVTVLPGLNGANVVSWFHFLLAVTINIQKHWILDLKSDFIWKFVDFKHSSHFAIRKIFIQHQKVYSTISKQSWYIGLFDYKIIKIINLYFPVKFVTQLTLFSGWYWWWHVVDLTK